jgi:sirohydrochlorin cobaltochelatase
MIGEGVCCCFMSQFPQEVLDEEQEKIANGCSKTPLAHR